MAKIFFLLLMSLPVIIKPQTNGKSLTLKKINQDIKIDGVIDPVWSAADSATDYFQLGPYYDKKPTWPTVAKVLTTDDALYCLIICYEDKNFIEPFTGTLDNTTGEYVSFMIDTFHDKKTAYKFIVSVSGVKGDARLLDDARTRDYNWDGIWFSATKIYDWGWVAEIKVPYKSIQYDKDLTKWGLDFDRWIPAKSEDLYWNRYECRGPKVFPRIFELGSKVFPMPDQKDSSTGS
jgi:hypothetical protein